MFRSRGENLRSVFILLFLNVAFFLLEHQDPEKYASLFRFDWNAVTHGEVWRLVTWQFTQAGDGWLETLALFVTLLLLSMMGFALEEEWGTRHFVALFALSTLTSAGVAAWLGISLLGTYFVYYTLLFVYAAAFSDQRLYLFGAVPVHFRLVAIVSLTVLLYGVFAGGPANIAALAGAVSGFLYFVTLRVRIALVKAQHAPLAGVPRTGTVAIHNAARVAGMKRLLSSGSAADAERLIEQCDRDTVPNVNICSPADFKPDSTDGYCLRCEGFAQCCARHLRGRLTPAAATTATPPAPPEPAPLV